MPDSRSTENCSDTLSRGVRFRPWIGAHYRAGLTAGRKVLILGESHYHDRALCTAVATGSCAWCDAARTGAFTTLAMRELALKHETRFFKTIRRLFAKVDGAGVNGGIGAEKGTDPDRFWSHVAFYNYVQLLMEHPRQPLSRAERITPKHDSAFAQTLAALRPDLILVLGKTNWLGLPGIRRERAGSPQNHAIESREERSFPLASGMGDLPRHAGQCRWLRARGSRKWALAGAVKHPGFGLTLGQWQDWVARFLSAELG